MRRSSAGFTLIELLFVVTLIGIMIAIAIPSFASFIANYRATAAVNDLLEAITLTRTEALKRGRRVTLLPNTTSGRPVESVASAGDDHVPVRLATGPWLRQPSKTQRNEHPPREFPTPFIAHS